MNINVCKSLGRHTLMPFSWSTSVSLSQVESPMDIPFRYSPASQSTLKGSEMIYSTWWLHKLLVTACTKHQFSQVVLLKEHLPLDSFAVPWLHASKAHLTTTGQGGLDLVYLACPNFARQTWNIQKPSFFRRWIRFQRNVANSRSVHAADMYFLKLFCCHSYRRCYIKQIACWCTKVQQAEFLSFCPFLICISFYLSTGWWVLKCHTLLDWKAEITIFFFLNSVFILNILIKLCKLKVSNGTRIIWETCWSSVAAFLLIITMESF